MSLYTPYTSGKTERQGVCVYRLFERKPKQRKNLCNTVNGYYLTCYPSMEKLLLQKLNKCVRELDSIQ